ncbi:MAG: hypothetical protein R3B84_19280 [Zavarzinella sp.]
MIRYFTLAAASLLALLPSVGFGHFLYIVPKEKEIQVIFSDSLEPDENVPIEKIAKFGLMQFENGKSVAVALKKKEHHLSAEPTAPGILHGSVTYGVLKRGEGKPFLLQYHAKAIIGKQKPAIGKSVPVEINWMRDKSGSQLQFLAAGEPVKGVEITVKHSGDKSDKFTTDDKGYTPVFAATGMIAAWGKVSTAKTGELEGMKYEEQRDYATLVVNTEDSVVKTKLNSYPALPKGVSSLGACTLDGYIYVYGGHCSKAHTYSKDTTLGTFHRLKLDGGQNWEKLAEGPHLQGLALVAHSGKIYRIAGTQPRNAEGEKTDMYSVDSFASYDPETGKWTDLPSLPAGRSSHDAVVVGDTLYVVGGWQMNGKDAKSTWHNTYLTINLNAQEMKWESHSQPFVLRALIAATHESKIFVLGGMDAEGGLKRTVNVLDTKTKSWSTSTDLPTGTMSGFSSAALSLDGKLYVSPADGTLYEFTKEEKWKQLTDLHHTRIVHRLVPGKAKEMIFLGGASRNGPVAEVESYVVK